MGSKCGIRERTTDLGIKIYQHCVCFIALRKLKLLFDARAELGRQAETEVAIRPQRIEADCFSNQLTVHPDQAGKAFLEGVLTCFKPFDDISVACLVPGAPDDSFFVTHQLVERYRRATRKRGIERYTRYIILREQGYSPRQAGRMVWDRGGFRHITRLARYGLA